MQMQKGGEIGHEGENYVSAIDGNDLVLTVDFTIQSIVEKYLEEACIDNKCTDGGNIVVMKVGIQWNKPRKQKICKLFGEIKR